jgi:hypothetical protein
MSKKEIIGAGICIILIWIGHLLVPQVVNLTGALGGTVALIAYPLGAALRKRHTPGLPVRTSTNGHVFPVRRRAMAGLGWFFVVIGAGTGIVLITAQHIDATIIMATLAAPILGAFFILSARNVREIRIDDHHIRFLPVGASLSLNEVAGIKPPARGDAPAYIALDTKIKRSRYVPGAILQWDGGCKLNIVGSNGDAVLSALRQRIPSA